MHAVDFHRPCPIVLPTQPCSILMRASLSRESQDLHCVLLTRGADAVSSLPLGAGMELWAR